jgi:hypothetical protein
VVECARFPLGTETARTRMFNTVLETMEIIIRFRVSEVSSCSHSSTRFC